MFGRSKSVYPTIEKPQNEVRLIEGGPMVFFGNFTIKGVDGSEIRFSPEQLAAGVAICRCGHSRTMPLCDGSHSNR